MVARRKEPAAIAALPPRRAVIDIGSNSVRLVIFDGPARAPMAICNEKALCGLGRTFNDDGSLDSVAVADAMSTLRRFRMILDAYGSPHTATIATAAVRDAKDGESFVQGVEALGYQVEVISGAEEAQLAALGVLSLEPTAKGLVGDMGGGSLELVSVDAGVQDDAASLPIGPLAVTRVVGGDQSKARGFIESEFAKVDVAKADRFESLFMVGGAWRSIARIHMNLKQYPLSVLHHYEMSAGSVIEVCDLVARQSRRSLEEIPGISRKRIDTLPFAAVGLKALLIAMKAKRVFVSAGGVREGLLYRALSDEDRNKDPLIEACRFFAARFSPEPSFGASALRVIKPLFADHPPAPARILEAAAELCDIAAFFHPDLRGRQAFDTALSAPLAGVTHEERVWIALVLFTRYSGRNAVLPDERAISLLDWDRQQGAIQAGLALRFAATLAPKTPALLKRCRLQLSETALVFSAPAALEPLLGESPRKRLDALASFIGRPAEIVFAD
ncbi:MAG: Ppx/GppA phosphatase family protein [Pseudomonadota bacterium]